LVGVVVALVVAGAAGWAGLAVSMSAAKRSEDAQRAAWGNPMVCDITEPGVLLTDGYHTTPQREVNVECPDGYRQRVMMFREESERATTLVWHNNHTHEPFVANEIAGGIANDSEPPVYSSWSDMQLVVDPGALLLGWAAGFGIHKYLERRRPEAQEAQAAAA
jgi:hypothetical protein